MIDRYPVCDDLDGWYKLFNSRYRDLGADQDRAHHVKISAHCHSLLSSGQVNIHPVQRLITPIVLGSIRLFNQSSNPVLSWVVSNMTESGSRGGTWCPAAGVERGNWDVRTLVFVFTFYWGIIGSGVTESVLRVRWGNYIMIRGVKYSRETQRAPPETIHPVMMLLFVNVLSKWPST